MSDTIVTIQPQIQTITTSAGQQILLTANPLINVVTAGTQGPAGQGLPTGGATAQVLRKNSGADYDMIWATLFSSGLTTEVKTVTTSTYTLVAADNGKIIRFTNNLTITLTCPNNFAVGFAVGIVQLGNGRVRPVAASGATILNSHGYEYTYAQGAYASLLVDMNIGGSAARYIFAGDVN